MLTNSGFKYRRMYLKSGCIMYVYGKYHYCWQEEEPGKFAFYECDSKGLDRFPAVPDEDTKYGFKASDLPDNGLTDAFKYFLSVQDGRYVII